jgi:hypothetical protein
VAALSAIILWQLVIDNNDGNNDCFEEIRDRIFAELHDDLIEEYGIKETPSRQMELAHLITSLQVIFNEIQIVNTKSKIFDLFDPQPHWDNWME